MRRRLIAPGLGMGTCPPEDTALHSGGGMVLGISISVHHALTSTANRWRATWDGQSLWVNQAAKLWAGRDPWREREQQPARDLLSSSLVTNPGSSSIRSAVAHWRCPGVG